MNDLVGVTIGRYEIQAKIGEGGMAMVYRAYDTRLKRDVALKVIHASNAQQERFFKRFERETRAMAVLTHPGIVQIYDVGDFEGLPYLVMEYLPGGTIKRYLGRPMAWQEAVSMLLPVSDALSFAHKQGIIHRDVKPSNILLDGMGRTRLSDFGIAKFMDQKETMELTGTNLGVGTPEYMAPEQGLGQDLDARADIYALATVCFELVTGQKPFHGSEALAILVRKINEPPPHAADVLHGLPDLLDQTLFKAMSSKPDARHATMASFGVSLSRVLGRGESDVSVEIPETEFEEQATQNFDLLSPESLEFALESYREKLVEMAASVPTLQEQLQEAVAAKEWGKVQEISETIKVCENSQATCQEMIARLSLISDLRKQGDEAIESNQWDGVDTIIIRLGELGQTGERYAQILKKGLQQARQESIEQISQGIANHIQEQDWLAVETGLAQLHDVGPAAEKMHADLQTRYQAARRAVEQQRTEIQRLTKLASEALDEADWARADAAIIALNRLGAEGQQAGQPLTEKLAQKRQGVEEQDARVRQLIAQLETAIGREDWSQAESALTELRQMDAKTWAARVEELAGELEARKKQAIQRERESAAAALAVEKQKAEIQRLSSVIHTAISDKHWQAAENGLSSLEGLGKAGQQETAKLAEQFVRARQEAEDRERRIAEAVHKKAETHDEKIEPAVEAVCPEPEISQQLEQASIPVALHEIVVTQPEKREKKPSGLIKKLLPIGAGLLAVAAAVILLGNNGSLPAMAMEETPAAVVLETQTATSTQLPTQIETPMPTATFTQVPTLIPTLGIGSMTISDKDQMEMVYVPAGEFIMGSDTGELNEGPAHKVYLDAFWIDKYEVTNEQFFRFSLEASYKTDVEKLGLTYKLYKENNSGWTMIFRDYWKRPEGYNSFMIVDHPVVLVSWNDAQAYCEWAGRRLPSEAEWEKAARGIDGKNYPWGNESPSGTLLNFNNIEGNSSTIGSYPSGSSPYGVLDMSGNVWEWVADWYDAGYYRKSPVENPTGLTTGQYRILRGGAWGTDEKKVRSTYRYTVHSNDWSRSGGFRCAVSASSSEINQYSSLELTTTPTPVATPTPAPDLPIGSTSISEVDGMEMVYVPAGEFTMGSDDEYSSIDEQPVHKVYLDGYWIDKYEVTNAQYSQCVSDGDCDQPSNITNYMDSNYANHPVAFVDWFNVQDYCTWAGRRLPSEAEWEKAARGTDGRMYPWGDQSSNASLLNYNGNENGTTIVGFFPAGASPYGALDMAGNVWEWTNSLYKGYPYDADDGREDLNSSGSWVLRGGSWLDDDRGVRAAVRGGGDPDVAVINIGFRCAVSAVEN